MKKLSRSILVLLLLALAGCATGPTHAPISKPTVPEETVAEAKKAETPGTGASTGTAGSETPSGSEPCEAAPSETETQAPKCANLPKEYLDALTIARRPKKENISRDLWPLLHDNEKLQWNDEDQVLMTTWTNPAFYPKETYKKGYTFTLYGNNDAFLTAVPEVQEWCTEYAKEEPGNLDYRLYQLLGLPPPQPGTYKRQFVEVWVKPQNLFRPCADPEITDYECQISIPFVGAKSPPNDTTEPPWLCPNLFVPMPQQVTGAFSQVNVESLSWVCWWWTRAYGGECAEDNYPWTALGYTFDWGNLENPKGPSEFVAVKGSQVVFESMTTTAEYCEALSKRK